MLRAGLRACGRGGGRRANTRTAPVPTSARCSQRPGRGVREPALAVFARLADAEARVHGVDPDRVQFHEVGSWDAIADIVGVCAALADLGSPTSPRARSPVGSGRVRTAHGDLPVPAPAVLDLARGWEVTSGGTGELATPTGLALVRELAARCGPLPAMAVDADRRRSRRTGRTGAGQRHPRRARPPGR